ncbi:hypothetical protein VKT23_019657 [Stygiomarasmius scandens]|uniref:Uncharacterized protein n=1 Tax=Marasmiellus scandens TaxID=2682957 RepID=A0ABR1IKZ8_9AGAR
MANAQSPAFTGAIPWLNEWVSIVSGPERGVIALVKDVQQSTSCSGLKLYVELQKITAMQVNPCLWVDFDDVRVPGTWQTLYEANPLSSSQSYYQTYSSYTPTAVHVPYVPQEIPICPTTPSPPEAEIVDELNIWNPLFDNEPEVSHWILHPSFEGRSLKVSLTTDQNQVEDIFVNIENCQVFIRGQWGHKIFLKTNNINKPIVPPLPNIDHGLLAIIDGEYSGRLVRRVHEHKIQPFSRHFVVVVENAGLDSEKIVDGPLLSVSKEDLTKVAEKNGSKKQGKNLVVSLKARAKKKNFSNFLYV